MKNYLRMKVYCFLIIFSHSILSTFAQNKPYRTSYIAKWGMDTASIETISIDGQHMYGEALHLYDHPNLKEFHIYFDKDGSIGHLDLWRYDLTNSDHSYQEHLSKQKGGLDFWYIDNNQANYLRHDQNRVDFVGGWVPLIGQFEWIVQEYQRKGNLDSLKFLNPYLRGGDIKVFSLGDQQIAFYSNITDTIKIHLDEEGHIHYINSMGTPWNYEIFRHDPVDIELFRSSFSRKEIIGDPSPHAEWTKPISGVEMKLDYGRPSRRGRQIFGSVVPFGEVWRTGAGKETTWSFDKDIQFEGQTIPAGTYNLYTIPNKESWTLIFNNEPNPWGPIHNPDFDLYKVRMKVSSGKRRIEKFTIDIEEEKGGGKLIMTWDNTRVEGIFNIL